MLLIFWSAANENCAMLGSGVCWIESSLSLGSPLKAKGLIKLMLLPSRESFLKAFSPAKESLFMIGKWFLVNDRCSTVGGSSFSGISVKPPELHNTWDWERQMHSGGHGSDTSSCWPDLTKHIKRMIAVGIRCKVRSIWNKKKNY